MKLITERKNMWFSRKSHPQRVYPLLGSNPRSSRNVVFCAINCAVPHPHMSVHSLNIATVKDISHMRHSKQKYKKQKTKKAKSRARHFKPHTNALTQSVRRGWGQK
jgi:hypothetical protein